MVLNHVDIPRSDELSGGAGISEHKGKISFFISFQGDTQVFFRFIRNVVFGIGGRFPVFTGIDTKNGEIAGMSGPHPVVGIATKLSDIGRRCSYQADVFKDFVYK
ncbi:MAG: hypothetical protein BWY27_00026 [Bacteroidetes bacterium ADurb.Bin234]|nr:MAG: hypothetical protein BWY27_00026 [Bacteroidetes bacterium ADurb.Bin234]